MTTNPRQTRHRRTLACILGLGLALFAAQPALALATHDAGEVAIEEEAAVPAPAELQALNDDLLGFGTNPIVTPCNTEPIPSEVLSINTFWAEGVSGEWTSAEHNGRAIPVDELERTAFEHEGEAWYEKVFAAALGCFSGGGFCACAAVYFTFSGSHAVACFACCAEGGNPFCACHGQYAYGACGCSAG